MNTLFDDSADPNQVEVLRVELRSEGHSRMGPYQAASSPDLDALSDLLAEMHRDDEARPPWFDDHWSFLTDTSLNSFNSVGPDALFQPGAGRVRPLACFVNREQYDAWFNDQAIKDLLSEMKFKLVSYMVPADSVLKSSSQGIFNSARATEGRIFPSL